MEKKINAKFQLPIFVITLALQIYLNRWTDSSVVHDVCSVVATQ